jgi:hypothetical protein
MHHLRQIGNESAAVRNAAHTANRYTFAGKPTRGSYQAAPLLFTKIPKKPLRTAHKLCRPGGRETRKVAQGGCLPAALQTTHRNRFISRAVRAISRSIGDFDGVAIAKPKGGRVIGIAAIQSPFEIFVCSRVVSLDFDAGEIRGETDELELIERGTDHERARNQPIISHASFTNHVFKRVLRGQFDLGIGRFHNNVDVP